jgi:lysine 2,3-aminomutase
LVPELAEHVADQPDPQAAREVLLDFLFAHERKIRDERTDPMRSLPFNLALQATKTLQNIFSARNEDVADCNAARTIWESLRRKRGRASREAFWQDIFHLFQAALGQSPMYQRKRLPGFVLMTGPKAGIARSRELDAMARQTDAWISRYPNGLSREAIDRREENRARILKAFGATLSDWQDYRWHLKHIIRDADTLGQLVRLSAAERRAIEKARENRIPFGITPYYVSLMDREAGRERDHAVRAQVLPPLDYVERMAEMRAACPHSLDFMAERDTSPITLVTRRYPKVAIFKPFNTCAQICVYCQRNWEIQDAMAPSATATKRAIQRALAWFRRHKTLNEVLITGGDPMLLTDEKLEWLLGEFHRMEHITHIRIGTRAPAVLPMRFTRLLRNIFAKYHHQEYCQICVVTHFEHPYEITPEARSAVQSIRRGGMTVYNQEVFTVENSRKFETAALRYALKEIGVDPYYNFNAKGKEETSAYRVPIARILQERKEEARLLPGTVRTDEPVFNLPRLGKNYLRAGQDHHIIGLREDGARVYEFLPWEKNLIPASTYIHNDVPIYDYLQRLARRGEDVDEYQNIWYYF